MNDTHYISFGVAALFFTACADPGPTYPNSKSSNSTANAINLSIVGDPTVKWNADDGKTTVVVQYSARDKDGIPLDGSKYRVELLLDSAPLDTESLLSQDSEVLQSNLYYSLVLDASYSMLEHNPPAFQPMLNAAAESVTAVQQEWARQAGEMQFLISWFNEVIYMQDGPWNANDIRSIPAPSAGTATKLFAAVDNMAATLNDFYNQGVYTGERDQYVMVVFSDGADNYSWFANPNQLNNGTTTSGADFAMQGSQAVTLDETLQRIADHPRLSVHVIGLGDDVKDEELGAMAAAGNGIYLKNPASTDISEMFARLTREFATLETRGALIPLPPGDYNMSLVAYDEEERLAAEVSFRFNTGDVNAGVLP